MSSSVAPVSALIGLKLRLPHSLTQISARMSRATGALKPAVISAFDERLDPRRALAARLADREAVALDRPHDAGLDELGRRVDDRSR